MKRATALLTAAIALLTLTSLLMPFIGPAEAMMPGETSPLDDRPDLYARAEIAAKMLFTPSGGRISKVLRDYMEKGVLPANVVVRDGKVDVAVFTSKSVDLYELSRHMDIYCVADLGVGYMVVGAIPSPKDLRAILNIKGVGRIVEDIKIDWKALVKREEEFVRRMCEMGVEPMNFRARALMKVDKVEEVFGINGSGITICIFDTGVDYAAYDLRTKIDRDIYGYPTVFDAGALCVALTNYTFRKTPDGFLPISSRPYYWVYWGGYYLRTDKKYYFVDFTKLPPLRDIYVGDIESKSGDYKFGILFEHGPAGDNIGYINQVYLCVVVDSKVPHVYDTLYIDFDTSLWLTAKLNEDVGLPSCVRKGLDISTVEFNKLPDWDITDEEPHYWGDPEGNSEILARDINGDGFYDVSAGVLGTVWGYFLPKLSYPRLIKGIDPSGNIIGIVYDWVYHGTACATSAAGRGEVGYDVFQNGTSYILYGMARGADVMSVLAFTRVRMWISWLWACGWDFYDPLHNQEWGLPFIYFRYSGKHKADIVSNSWGYVYFDIESNSTQGFYLTELMIDLLSVPGFTYPDYPGTLFVVSAGNEGSGYITVGAPSVSPAALTVGATTSFHVWEPDYGRPQPADELVSWTSRGPSQIGYPKPDVATLGAYGFSSYPLMKEARFAIANQWNCWGWFGGTSMSCPLAAGVCALVMQAYRQAHGRKPTPDVVKYIIKSTADDLGYDSLTQGSGKINAYRAVAAALGLDELEGEPIVLAYSSQAFREAASVLNKPFLFWWGSDGQIPADWHGKELTQHPGLVSTLYDTALYFWTRAGETCSATVYAITPTGQAIDNATAYHYALWDKRTFELGSTEGRVYTPFVLTEILGEDYMENYFYQADYAVLAVTYDRDVFMKFYRLEQKRYPYVFLHDWEDVNLNGVIDMPGTKPGAPGEVRRISSCHLGGNVLIMYVSYPGRKFHRYDPTGTWRGPTIFFHDTGPETGPLRPWPGIELKLTILLFKKQPWDWATITQINPMNWRVTVNVPDDAMPGVFAAFIEFRKGSGKAIMPICVVVHDDVPKGPDWLTFGNRILGETYEPWAVYGQHDMYYYPLASDFRLYPIKVPDPDARYLAVKVEWIQEDTFIGVWVMNETGQLVGMSNMTWLIRGRGWVGTTTMPRGQFLIMPIWGSGIYYIVIQTMGFGNEVFPEPITISVCYLTKSVPSSTPTWSIEEGDHLKGPHATVSVAWDQVMMSQLPGFSIKAVELRAYGGHYNLTWLKYRGKVKEGWYEFWHECELYAYQNFTKGQLAYVEVGWNKTYYDTEIDVFVWEPGVSHTYENSLTGWKTTRYYHNNPQRGSFPCPLTGTYTIGIDIWWAGADENKINVTGIWVYVLTSTLRGGRIVANGTEACIDTHITRRNGLTYIISRAFTYTNIIYEARITIYVHNYFKPVVTLERPTPGSTLSDVVDVVWSIEDENKDEEHVTDVYVSLDGGETWDALAYSVKGASVKWDTRPESPVGTEYTDKAMIRLVVSDGKYIVQEEIGYFTIDNRGVGPGPGPAMSPYVAVGVGAAIAAVAAGAFIWRRRRAVKVPPVFLCPK